MDAKARLALNLNVLRRHDSGGVEEIIDSAAFVVAYRYDGQIWAKSNIEGTLFLYRRTTAPHYHFFILNRPTPVNFSAPLIAESDLQFTDEYIIYRRRPEDEEGKEEIWGIWIYDDGKGERQRIGLTMQRLCALGKESDKPISDSNLLNSFLAQAATSDTAPPTSQENLTSKDLAAMLGLMRKEEPVVPNQTPDLLAMLGASAPTPQVASPARPTRPMESSRTTTSQANGSPRMGTPTKTDRTMSSFLASTVPLQVMSRKSKKPPAETLAQQGSPKVDATLASDPPDDVPGAVSLDAHELSGRSTPGLTEEIMPTASQIEPTTELINLLVRLLRAKAKQTSIEYETMSDLLRGVSTFFRDPAFTDALWTAYQSS